MTEKTWEFVLVLVASVVFSDVAAVLVTICREKHTAKKTRERILKGLRNELTRATVILEKPEEYVSWPTRLPTHGFGVALFESPVDLRESDELLAAAVAYLAYADEVNDLVNAMMAGVTTRMDADIRRERLRKLATEMLPPVIDQAGRELASIWNQ